MQQQNDHIARINKVIRYIEQNIDKKLPLNELAALANYSPFHFQRIFKSAIGETPKQHIKRLRLEGAAHLIMLKPAYSILEVALSFGFSSLEAFSRAFRNHYNVSPDHFKQMKDEEKLKVIEATIHKNTQFDITPFLPSSNNDSGDDFSAEVVRIPTRKIIYIQTTLGSYDQIIASYKKLKTWAHARSLTTRQSQLFGLMRDYPLFTELSKCRYLCGLSIEEKIETTAPINYMELPARTYAAFQVQGGINELVKKTTRFYNHWLPENGFALAHEYAVHLPLNDPLTVSFDENTYQLYLAIHPV